MPAVNRNAVADALLRRLSTPAGVGNAPLLSGPAQGIGGFSPYGAISPTVAQTYDWVAGSRTAASTLPRDALEFLTGAFGPTVPMPPAPVDLPAPGELRPDPRRWQYPVGYNLPSGVPGSEGLKLASFANLRAFADLYSVARACLNVRENEILGVDWDIVPTDDASIAMREDSGAAEDFQKRVREAKAFFDKPDPNYKSYHEWLRAILEDVLVLDAPSVYVHPPRVSGMGVLKSNLASLDVIDGATIKPLVDLRGSTPTPPNPAYAQYLYGVPRREMMDLILSEELELDGEPTDQFRGDQLLYLRYQPRSWTPYGFSVIEQCILPIAIGLKGQQYTLAFYTEGSVPDTYIVDGRPQSTAIQSNQLQNMLNATAADVAYRRKVIVLPFNSKPIPMKPQALTAGLAQEYAEHVCMVIDVSPQEIGLSPGGGKGGGLGGKGYTEQQENATFRKSLIPLLTWLKRELFDVVLQTVLGQADMTWKWLGFEPAEDREKTVAAITAQRNAGLISTDEGRIELGMDPFGTDITSKPFYFTGSGAINLEDGTTIAISGGAPPALGPGAPTPGGPDGTAPASEQGTAQALPSADEAPLSDALDSIDHSEPVKKPEGKAVVSDVRKYSEDRPRDDRGRFGEGDDSSATETPRTFSSPEESKDWGTAHYGEAWASSLSPEERKAITGAKGYTTDLNNHLRGIKDLADLPNDPVYAGTRAYNERLLAGLDSLFSHEQTQEPLVAYRGIRVGGVAALDLHTGMTFTDLGFSSTSLRSDIAEKFAEKGGAVVEIAVPRGAAAAYLDGSKLSPGNKRAKQEQELLLNRGTTFRVTHVETLPKTRSGLALRVHMEVVR